LATGAKSEPELAHVLFMDIVGCSKLPTDEQKRIVGRLQELVRGSPEFQRSRESDELISLPTGDGMALVFFNKLDAAVQCALEITKEIQAESLCKIRMGVHTGPVFVMEDINHKRNVSGAGINRAERVMSCGSDGHILLSDNVAESLRHLSVWRDKIYEVGDCQVKDGWIGIWNLVDGPIGNPALPKKSKRFVHRRRLVMAACGAALALALAVAVVGAFRMGRSGRSPLLVQDEASIAVLPFADMSPEKNQEYFSDGLTEELINGLAKTPGLRVAGRTSSFQFKNKAEDSQVIGGKLNVATILEGSVRKQGNRVRIAVQLIKAEDGFELWSDTFDRELNDIFALQEEISRSVTKELSLKLLAKKKAARATESTNAQAYNAYLQGRYFLLRNNKENLAKAIGYFEQATNLDPSYAPAWVGLAESHRARAVSTYVSGEEGYTAARKAAERALALDPDLAAAHAEMGLIKMYHDWDWAGAEASYRRALALEPGSATVIRDFGALDKILGRLDQAIMLYREAVQIDPLSTAAHRNLGAILYFAGRQEEATAAFKKALELAPEIVFVHGWLAQVYMAQGRLPEALAEAAKEKHPIFRLLGMALVNHAVAQKKQSDDNLAELVEKFGADAPYTIAQVYAFRGETDRAFEWLAKAYSTHDDALYNLKVDPLLKSLAHDGRYKALLQKMHLPL
jgi:TolB-like protein/class 3 adenylate cyclase